MLQASRLRSAGGRQLLFCHSCRQFHLCATVADEIEYRGRHRGHLVTDRARESSLLSMFLRVARDTGANLFRVLRREGGATILALGLAAHPGYTDNASVKQAFGSATAFTVTNANLTSSATAGWKGNAIDNSSNLYDDALVMIDLASASWTADKQIYYFTYGLVDASGSIYTSTGDGTIDGSEGTVTFPDVTAHAIVMPTLGVIPTPVTSKALRGGPWGVARRFDGVLPPKWGIACVNQGGATLSVTSYKYIEVYYTVA